MNTPAQVTEIPVRDGQTTSAELVSVTEAKSKFANLIERVRQRERVVLTRNERPIAVLLSYEDYTEMAQSIPDPLRALEARFQGLLGAIKSPASVAASTELHNATSAELGAAAQASARARGRGG